MIIFLAALAMPVVWWAADCDGCWCVPFNDTADGTCPDWRPKSNYSDDDIAALAAQTALNPMTLDCNPYEDADCATCNVAAADAHRRRRRRLRLHVRRRRLRLVHDDLVRRRCGGHGGGRVRQPRGRVRALLDDAGPRRVPCTSATRTSPPRVRSARPRCCSARRGGRAATRRSASPSRARASGTTTAHTTASTASGRASACSTRRTTGRRRSAR